MGAVTIPVDKVVSGEKIEGWFDLEAPTTKVRGKPMKAQVHKTLWVLHIANHSYTSDLLP